MDAIVLSTIAVEKGRSPTHIDPGTSSHSQEGMKMRILEMATAGIIAIGAQLLVVGALLI